VISSIPELVLQPILYALPIYFGCDLRHGTSHLLVFLGVHVAISFAVNGLVWSVVAYTRSFPLATFMSNSSFVFLAVSAGFYVNYADLPVYIGWIQNIDWMTYAYRLLMVNQFAGTTITSCASGNPASCVEVSGAAILHSRDVGENDFESSCVGLAAIIFVYYTLTCWLLTYQRHPVVGSVGGFGTVEPDVLTTDNVARELRVGADLEAQNIATSLTTTITVDINIHNVTYSVSSRDKAILRDVSGEIKAGRLVALMGGSGSGKTTLLNIIAGRIKAERKDCLTGSVLYNNKAVFGSELRQIVGYGEYCSCLNYCYIVH
jgi:ABC-type multidrug transport system fused ATPase/permease subunit